MADSPKCLDCIKDGKKGQTYKVAGKPLYKCSDCKDTYHEQDFDPVEFTWKDETQAYKDWLKSKGIVWGERYVA